MIAAGIEGRPEEMRLARAQAARIVAVDRVQLGEDAEKSCDVVGATPVDDVEVDRRHRRSLQDARGHSHDDELDVRGGQ